MLYKKPKNDAMEIHERAVKKYNAEYEKMQGCGVFLYQKRRECVRLIEEIEAFVSGIANSPKEFEKNLLEIQAEKEKFHSTEEYGAEALSSSVKSGVGVATGLAAGTAVASLAPSAAMWVATTFGTASTGTAISALHGAVATKAALAWLGGGALSAGGAGIAGGQALLALAGPVGWGIAGAAAALSVFSKGKKNKKIADEAIEEARKVTIAGANLHETTAKIQSIIDKTSLLYGKLGDSFNECKRLKGSDYLSLADSDQKRLGILVNNTFSLAELLNETV